MINVVNIKTHKSTPLDIRISRPTVLGNPFTHLKGKTLAKFTVDTREEAVSKHYQYLENQILSGDKRVLAALSQIKQKESHFGNVNLVCYCAPLSCHGDNIRELIRKYSHLIP